MKIGIAIPCHFQDLNYLQLCLESIKKLDPPPFKAFVNVNNGDHLKNIRNDLFNSLFNVGCDVVLQCSSDFYLMPNILKHVDANKVTTFTFLSKRLSDLTCTTLGMITRNDWTGCYALPLKFWAQIKNDSRWDGTDHSIRQIIPRKNIKIIRLKYYCLRAWKPLAVRKLMLKKSLPRRIFWMATRLKGNWNEYPCSFTFFSSFQPLSCYN